MLNLKRINISSVIKLMLFIFISLLIINTSYADDEIEVPTDLGPNTIQQSQGKAWSFANATGINPSGEEIGPLKIVQYALNGILSILALIFLILIIYSGFMWMTSAGIEDKIKKAKATLKNAIIGVIIILFSFIITQFIFNTIEPTTKAPENHTFQF